MSSSVTRVIVRVDTPPVESTLVRSLSCDHGFKIGRDANEEITGLSYLFSLWYTKSDLLMFHLVKELVAHGDDLLTLHPRDHVQTWWTKSKRMSNVFKHIENHSHAIMNPKSFWVAKTLYTSQSHSMKYLDFQLNISTSLCFPSPQWSGFKRHWKIASGWFFYRIYNCNTSVWSSSLKKGGAMRTLSVVSASSSSSSSS